MTDPLHASPDPLPALADPLHRHRLLATLARLCATDRGEAAALSLQPAPTAAEADARMDRVDAARALLDARPSLPHKLDFTDALHRAERDAVLEAAELHALGVLARHALSVARAAKEWPAVTAAVALPLRDLPDLGVLAGLLEESVDGEGHVLDSASPELGRLRREVVALAARLRRRIEELVRESDDQGVLQDDYWTLRDDRYVLPVKSSDKRVLKGIVHGSSQTGQTVYVEPEELVQGNNQLALLFDAVRREEYRILQQLSTLCAADAAELRLASDLLADLDFACAAGELAKSLDAHRPRFDDARLDLPRARHPLLVLDGAAVVANDVEVQAPARWLVVSGPNGGGKTVLLATVALAVEMARLGLHVCAGPGARLPWCEGVLVVMGDAQDLVRGLSTFEGHLRAVQAALSDASRSDRALLVVIDELASGTEPAAGSALGTALLQAFGKRCPTAWGLCSTHHESPKLLALRDPAFANAALSLDPATLRPTWRLRLGEIGSSNPLALAERIGLDKDVLADAHALAGGAGSDVAHALQRLQQMEALLHDQLAEVERQRLHLDRARALLDDQRRNEQKAADRRVDKVAGEALRELQAVQREVEEARAALRSQDRHALERAAGVVSHRTQEVQRIQQRVQARASGVDLREPVDLAALRPGSEVWHDGLGRKVAVAEIDARNARVKVRAGVLESWADAADLRAAGATVQPAPIAKPKSAVEPRSLPALTPVPLPPTDDSEDTLSLRTAEWTCDVRGHRVDEALAVVDQLLDRAVVRGAIGVCVVHGMGTGAVRDAVRKHCKGHSQVARFRAGVRGEGGDGVTLVWMAA
jgi:DNA mismatch repair protein MutS2